MLAPCRGPLSPVTRAAELRRDGSSSVMYRGACAVRTAGSTTTRSSIRVRPTRAGPCGAGASASPAAAGSPPTSGSTRFPSSSASGRARPSRSTPPSSRPGSSGRSRAAPRRRGGRPSSPRSRRRPGRGPGGPERPVGLAVLERLRVLDPVSYLRFASVYKGFEDLADFEREFVELQKTTAPKRRGAPSGRRTRIPSALETLALTRR